MVALAPAVPANTAEIAEKRSAVGRRLPSLQALGHVTGSTRYTDDLTLPGMLHAHPLYSTHDHARIVDVALSAARDLLGVVDVIVGADMPEIVRALPSRTSRLLPTKKSAIVGISSHSLPRPIPQSHAKRHRAL